MLCSSVKYRRPYPPLSLLRLPNFNDIDSVYLLRHFTPISGGGPAMLRGLIDSAQALKGRKALKDGTNQPYYNDMSRRHLLSVSRAKRSEADLRPINTLRVEATRRVLDDRPSIYLNVHFTFVAALTQA